MRPQQRWKPGPFPPTLTSDERKEALVAEPVTAPTAAGLLRDVFTRNFSPPGPTGPSTSTCTTDIRLHSEVV